MENYLRYNKNFLYFIHDYVRKKFPTYISKQNFTSTYVENIKIDPNFLTHLSNIWTSSGPQ